MQIRASGRRKSSEQQSVEEAARRLQQQYGDFPHHNRKNPLEELLFILCSVQTDEKKYRATFGALRRAFPRFDGLASASARAIAKPLKPGGLSPTKSKAIRRICTTIQARFGKMTLAPLRRMSDVECEAFLTSLPGVGLKVARCVMMYSLGRTRTPSGLRSKKKRGSGSHIFCLMRLARALASPSKRRAQSREHDNRKAIHVALHVVETLPRRRRMCAARRRFRRPLEQGTGAGQAGSRNAGQSPGTTPKCRR